MKKLFSKSVVCLVTGLFTFSGLFCCCLVPSAQAEQSAASCHHGAKIKTQHKSGCPLHTKNHPAQSSSQCSCGTHSLHAVVPSSAAMDVALASAKGQTLISAAVLCRSMPSDVSLAWAGKSPPSKFSKDLPLYLKFAVLRI